MGRHSPLSRPSPEEPGRHARLGRAPVSFSPGGIDPRWPGLGPFRGPGLPRVDVRRPGSLGSAGDVRAGKLGPGGLRTGVRCTDVLGPGGHSRTGRFGITNDESGPCRGLRRNTGGGRRRTAQEKIRFEERLRHGSKVSLSDPGASAAPASRTSQYPVKARFFRLGPKAIRRNLRVARQNLPGLQRDARLRMSRFVPRDALASKARPESVPVAIGPAGPISGTRAQGTL